MGADGDSSRAKDHQARRQSAAASPFVLPLLRQAGNQTVSSVLAPPQGGQPGRRGQGPDSSVQRDVVSDVEEKMSYSITDWATTDQEATDALNELAELSGPALATAMGQLSQKAKTRLLDHLPDAARHTSGFAKVLVAMGPEAVQPYVQSLLSYGIFDWAITDADAEGVFRVMVALQPAQQSQMARGLGSLFRGRLAGHLARNATIGDVEHGAVRALFDATPDEEGDTLKQWMHVRFRVAIGRQTGGSGVAQDWDGPSLRRMYNVLQALPPGAVESDPALARIDRYKDPGPAGGYYGS